MPIHLVPALLQSIRPHQWVKNALVLVPLMFAHKWDEAQAVRQAVVAFLTFCALSSSIYLLNDIVDREADRRHPTKRNRPIASGRVGVGVAGAVAIALLLAACAGAMVLHEAVPSPRHVSPFWVWAIAYAAMNLAYSWVLKHRVILDCLCIAIGFQFRVLAGGAAADVEVSKWLILCTFFFSLFLAFCKRREELVRSGDESTRANLRYYTVPFLDQIIAPLAALSILTYALYTVDARTIEEHGTQNLMFTVPIVVFGVFRYLFLIHFRGGGEDPAKLLFRDPHLVACGLLWAGAVALIIAQRS